jgi:hypothetical protein
MADISGTWPPDGPRPTGWETPDEGENLRLQDGKNIGKVVLVP